MNKEMLDIVNDLSKKPTTDLALQIMELSGENLILEQQCKKQKEVIDKVKFAIKTNCIKNDKKYEEICCDGDYLLKILEDKEVE